MFVPYRPGGQGGNSPGVRSDSKREEGVVVEFSYQWGHGLIRPRNGGEDVFVNLAAVEASRIKRLEKDARVSYRLAEIGPGQFRAADIRLISERPEMERGRTNSRNVHHLNKKPQGTPASHAWIRGVIKWFDLERGYGFVKFPNGQKDAYLSKQVLGTLQMTLKKPLENMAVKVQLKPGKILDSIEVSAIAF